MELDKSPTMTLVCGCNGAGKSTITYATLGKDKSAACIDPDLIAKEKNCSPLEAGRIALSMTQQFLDEEKSFIKESTLSSKSDLKLMDKAKNAGFIVKLFYIGLRSASDAVDRVKNRYENGGHSVPEEDIHRRYGRSHENLPDAIRRADYATITDNSGNDYKHVATFKNGQLTAQSSSPDWFNKVLKRFKTEQAPG